MQQTTPINDGPVNLHPELEKENSEKEILGNKLADLAKEMNQFTYIVSHDLQAPLRMVTGFLELLEKKYSDKLDEQARQYIDYAVKGAAKMKSLLLDLLEYSRVSSVVNEYAEVDLNEIVQEVKEKFRPVIENAEAIITSDHLPVVMADRAQLLQLFGHLFDNALKFRGITAPEINLTLKKEDGTWVIAVKDNGVGVDPAFAEKIFTVFRRLYSDESKYSGNGIGLAVCKKIVELHGGTIWTERAAEKGSTFCFTLPAKLL